MYEVFSFSQINFVFIVIALRVILKNQKGKAQRTGRKRSKQKSIARYLFRIHALDIYNVRAERTELCRSTRISLVSFISLAKPTDIFSMHACMG